MTHLHESNAWYQETNNIRLVSARTVRYIARKRTSQSKVLSKWSPILYLMRTMVEGDQTHMYTVFFEYIRKVIAKEITMVESSSENDNDC